MSIQIQLISLQRHKTLVYFSSPAPPPPILGILKDHYPLLPCIYVASLLTITKIYTSVNFIFLYDRTKSLHFTIFWSYFFTVSLSSDGSIFHKQGIVLSSSVASSDCLPHPKKELVVFHIDHILTFHQINLSYYCHVSVRILQNTFHSAKKEVTITDKLISAIKL